MPIYIVRYSAGMAGTDMYEKVEADSADDAIDCMVDVAWEWHEGFDQNHNDDSDENFEPELDISAELYFPAHHDMLL